jgi:hypothetical protein
MKNHENRLETSNKSDEQEELQIINSVVFLYNK